ncbi:MAG: sialidase family protein [Sulfuricellaceae bacterium]
MRKYILGSAILFAVAPAWAGMGAWSALTSPTQKGGNVIVYKLARHPTNPLIRYAATQNGMYKSTDGGASWQTANTGITPSPAGYVGVNDMAIDPQNPQNIYIAPYYLQKSVDGGNTWSRTGWVTENPQAYMLAIDPKTPGTLYAGSNHGIYKSTDGAATWKYMTGTKVAYALTIDPNNPSVLYEAVSSGLFKSSDGGASLVSINANLTSVKTIAVDPKNSANIYVGTFGSGVYKSSDGGATWNAANQCYPVNGYAISLNNATVEAFAFDAADSSIIYLGAGDGIYKSVDGGAHWTQANNGPMNGASTLMLDPNDPATVIAGNNNGIFSYTFPATATPAKLTASCPTTLNAGATATCTATYDTDSSVSAAWTSSNPAAATMNGNTITAGNVAADTTVSITATYTANGMTQTATATVNIKAAAASLSGADCVLNWGEKTYPELFSPSPATSKTFGDYYYRYYSGTKSYLGTAKNQRLVYVGVLSNGSILDVGDLATWLTTAGCR